MSKERFEGFQAIACAIRISAQLDPNPNVGRLYPKEFDYLMKMAKKN